MQCQVIAGHRSNTQTSKYEGNTSVRGSIDDRYMNSFQTFSVFGTVIFDVWRGMQEMFVSFCALSQLCWRASIKRGALHGWSTFIHLLYF